MPTLHWLNDEEARKAAQAVPYRLLEEDLTLSYGDPRAQNLLIQGDNLAALKSLQPYFSGQVKCIYIDPPYNTGSAFEHYDDNLEHSTWLTMMYPRMELLRELLAENGSIWVSIDDNECHYLKVIMDDIFGRNNFLASIIWQKIYTVKNTAKHFSDMHDYILVYAKNISYWKRNDMPRTEKQDNAYKNPDNDPRGIWKATPIQARNFYSKGLYPVRSPSGRIIQGPPKGTYWRFAEETFLEMDRDNRIWWGRKGNSIPAQKRFLSEVQKGVVPATFWPFDIAGHNAEAKNEIRAIFADNSEIFLTPKPEKLLQQIIHIASNPGDIVLDSFLGSGTTAAVAHKMDRRYIAIEMGEHANTHCAPRLRKVTDGEQGGISKSVEWQGGDGFHYFRLGEPVFDENKKINPKISFRTLAAHVWFSETHQPYTNLGEPCELLGVHNNVAYYLIYNGILGDRRREGGNVLTRRLLRLLPQHEGPKVIYGEVSLMEEAQLRQENITFKKIPYELQTR